MIRVRFVSADGDKVQEILIDFSTERGIQAARTVQNAEVAHNYGPLLDKAPGTPAAALHDPVPAFGRTVPHA